jgi:hypothetical protein
LSQGHITSLHLEEIYIPAANLKKILAWPAKLEHLYLEWGPDSYINERSPTPFVLEHLPDYLSTHYSSLRSIAIGLALNSIIYSELVAWNLPNFCHFDVLKRFELFGVYNEIDPQNLASSVFKAPSITEFVRRIPNVQELPFNAESLRPIHDAVKIAHKRSSLKQITISLSKHVDLQLNQTPYFIDPLTFSNKFGIAYKLEIPERHDPPSS